MVFRRKGNGRRRRRRPAWPLGRILLWAVLIVQGLWIAGFVWSTGGLVPPGLSLGGRSAEGEAGWTREKQSELQELEIQKMIHEKGSQGDSPSPPSP